MAIRAVCHIESVYTPDGVEIIAIVTGCVLKGKSTPIEKKDEDVEYFTRFRYDIKIDPTKSIVNPIINAVKLKLIEEDVKFDSSETVVLLETVSWR